jgi:hypothetical protein
MFPKKQFVAIHYGSSDDFPVFFVPISNYQPRDKELQLSLNNKPEKYKSCVMHKPTVFFQFQKDYDSAMSPLSTQ